MSAANRRAFAEADSLYRAGRFGKPGTDGARNAARTHFQLRTSDGITCILEIAADRSPVCIEEADVAEPFGRVYANFGIYPIDFLVQGVAGDGGFCLDYEYPFDFEGTVLMGGSEVEAEVEWLEYEGGGGTHAFRLKLPTREHKTVDLLFESRLCGRARTGRVVDRGDTLEVMVLRDLQGMYVRKAGTHALSALAFWRTAVRPGEVPDNPRIGACAYFPRIHLRLPAFLPDFGLDDLRDFEYPRPLVEESWYREVARRPPEWLEVRPGGIAEPWPSLGPRPEFLSDEFPDL